MKNLFNLPSFDIYYLDFLEKIKLTYTNKIISQLSHIKNTEKGKLRFFSINVYTTFELQKNLTFDICFSFSTWLRQYLQYLSSAGVKGLLYLSVSIAKE
jgi:hypothetical protein